MNYIYTPFFKGECKTERDWGRGVGRKGGNTFKQEICVEHLLHISFCSTVGTNMVPALKEFFQKLTKMYTQVKKTNE